MKLLFIYIHQYKGIREQGFNLSADFDINFENDSDRPFLSIDKKEENQAQIFHNNIIDIKGIIGENGAGKTSLLDFISNECFANVLFQNSKVKSNRLLVYEHEGRIKVVVGRKWKLVEELVKVKGEVDFSFQKDTIWLDKKELFWGDIPDFLRTKFVLFSNVFDRKDSVEANGLINVSTNYLLTKDVDNYLNGETGVAQVTAHRIRELNRQVRFALKFNDFLPFTRPSKMDVTFSNRVAATLRADRMKFDDGPEISEDSFAVRIDNWLKQIESDEAVQFYDSKSTFLVKLQQAYLTYFIRYELMPNGQIDFDNYNELAKALFDKILLRVRGINKWIELDEIIDEAKHFEAQLRYQEHKIISETWSNKLTAFRNLEVLLNKSIQDKLVFNKRVRLDINIGEELLEYYESSLHITDYLSVSLPELSTGEGAFLTLFSRFFAVTDKKWYPNENIKNSDNLVVLIDEGDLYFHPYWQSRFIQFMNQILPAIFKGKKLQILVTSHSQFIASDLPSDNLLFLRRGSEEFCEVVDGPKNTFAANIHDLLSDAFFLKGAHIGEFAKSIIYKILDDLEGKSEKRNFSNQELKKLIELIGEDWVKSQLQEKYKTFLLSQ